MGWQDSAWIQRLREISRQMWFRVTLFSLGGVALALLAQWIGPYLPYIPEIELASGSVSSLLNIIASSMLAVTTFSMSIIIGAYGSATNSATPRATELLAMDTVAQNAVSVFIGSFLFSIVGIIGLSAGFYAAQGRVLLFAATLLNILLIVWTLLRWVDHLNRFGRMTDIIGRIETAATNAACLYRDNPRLGARPLPSGLAGDACHVLPKDAGFVRFIDIPALQDAAEKLDIRVEVLRMPGKYVHRHEPLMAVSRDLDQAGADRLRDAFTLGLRRSFDQDIRYGMIVLSEVASRALSAAINDPGTAIDVIRAGGRVLAEYHRPADETHQAVRHDRIHVPELEVRELYREFFSPIVRHGAAEPEVIQALLDSVEALGQGDGDKALTRRIAHEVRVRAVDVLKRNWERRMLQ
ncbi:DUF2254 domain-containing protein [Paracoccus chinensis]|uniref:Uncharacterized membrane protein n=1 Tax=Paracoccus chinensis TaxID=525640 RepID=A0A1G9I4L3_9RHOB|nr:DUF2254 domain-containing protein [Paracoccus chinensis]SDL19753.1 Uncharacterized membrane protein [Paracoccus chinensis]